MSIVRHAAIQGSRCTKRVPARKVSTKKRQFHAIRRWHPSNPRPDLRVGISFYKKSCHLAGLVLACFPLLEPDTAYDADDSKGYET